LSGLERRRGNGGIGGKKRDGCDYSTAAPPVWRKTAVQRAFLGLFACGGPLWNNDPQIRDSSSVRVRLRVFLQGAVLMENEDSP